MNPDIPDRKPLTPKERKQIANAETIKARLKINGFTLTDVDSRYSLPKGTAHDALRNPNLKGERAIAAALGTRPELLWRDRYHASGQRRSGLDYTRPPTIRERQKRAGSLA